MKIVFIIPYFGKFPQWFQVFLNSIKDIKSADFLIFTDDRDSYSYPQNTKVIYTTFNEVKNSFKKKVGFNIHLENPYKLCDYRPLYGEVFQKHIFTYGYWGYCDLDMIFGDLDHFLQTNNFFEEEYDRFSRAGHLTIYKNNERINSLYKTKIKDYNSYFGFDLARKTSFPTHFDEVGMNMICYQSNIKYFDKILYGNVPPESEIFTIQYTDRPEILYRFDGKIYASYLNSNGKIDTIEIMYLHIMRRGNLPINVQANENYIITHTGFHPFEIDKLETYFLMYGNKKNLNEVSYAESFRKINRSKTINMLYREVLEFPFLFLPHLFKRFYATQIIKKIKY